ncbi:MAG: class I SAM-dependent methyltransferase [Methanomassiliicoccus sp.]|nr:class I SAM-dependent methyltransferase [Methanomassiliicoccus sp.]
MTQERMYLDRRLQDNEVGEYRPNEALIEAVASRMLPSGRALDLSNDNGIDALFLAQSGYAVALVGFYPGELEIARRRVDEMQAKVQLYSTEPTKMPFHPGEFDMVFDPRTYTSLKGEERDLFLAEIMRVLRPEGIFVAVVPSFKDSVRGCFTKQNARAAFEPPFTVMRVEETSGWENGATRSYYSIMMRRP